MQNEPGTLPGTVIGNSLRLALIAAVAAIVLALVFDNTRERIALQRDAAERATLAQLLPPSEHDNDLVEDSITLDPAASEYRNIELLGLRGAETLYIARLNNRVNGLILPAVARDGYNGDISMLVAVNADGTLSGVRISAHRETPGLGDKIELRIADWILDFDGLSLRNTPRQDWAVIRDGGRFDQFTGATITPRAVVSQVRQALEFYEANRQALLNL